MAFVFCDDRWKKNKENKQPGPGQYSIETPFNNQKEATNQPRPFTSFKKKRNEISNPKPQQNAAGFKQWLSSGIFKRDVDFMNEDPDSPKMRKGKIHRNVTCVLKKTEDLSGREQQKQPDFKIQNQKQNTWGNKKIVQFLGKRKRKNSKTQLGKKASSCSYLLKNNLYNYQLRQKLSKDLIDLQSMFPANKNDEIKNSLKSMMRQKFAKMKAGESYNHTYSKTEIKSQLTSLEQRFEISPASVYKSPRKQKEEASHKSPPNAKSFKFTSRDENLPTGCSDYLFEDSLEYIDENTPGPGSYTSSISAINLKQKSKVQQFGVTMQRFKFDKKVPQIPINPIYPEFKASSQANQQDVGFGTTTKQQKQRKPVHNGIFYDDCNNFQNKVKKIGEKALKQKFVFGSCKQRFGSRDQKKSLEEQSESEDDEEQQEEGDFDKKVKIPTNVFLSKVSRDFPINTCTEDVDYSGQNFNCLANKLKKQKEFYEDYEINPAPFNSKEERFRAIQEVEKKEKSVDLKIQKAQQTKKKKDKVKRKLLKGFKFPKESRENSQQKEKGQHTPPPNKYLNSPKWIKSTYNIRFT